MSAQRGQLDIDPAELKYLASFHKSIVSGLEVIDRLEKEWINPHWISHVPSGTSGPWSVSRFTIDQQQAEINRLRAAANPQRPYRWVPPGDYTRLCYNGQVVMSDTLNEYTDHIEAIDKAHGHVLIAGLGLGCYLNCLLHKPEVTKITLVEIDRDVLRLVYPFVTHRQKTEIVLVNSDITTWKPKRGTHYDIVWLDIWPEISADNWEEMQQLERFYRRRAGWVGSWSKQDVIAVRREERRYGIIT